VTGFSLAGHALEMAEGSQVTIKIDTKKIPFLPDVEEYAKMGLVPEGTYRNKEFLREKIKLNDTIKESFEDLLFDPQTSGGLLVSLKKKDAKEVLKRLQEQEQTRYSKIVGEVEEKQEVHLIFL
jgi:selenide,water dikinase